MRSSAYAIFCAAMALLLACVVVSSSATPPREKNTWNYDGGVLLVTDGSIPGGPCFRVSGRLTAPSFFDDLKRISNDTGSIFRSGAKIVTHFPDQVLLAFVIYDLPCSTKLQSAGTRVFLTRSLMSSLQLNLYWKRGIDLRPITTVEPKYFSVDPVMPYAAALAHDLPEKLQWAYEYAIPSAGVPLTDSLVMIIRTPDGRIAARVAARL
jgi:hypothetical protein